eukprot:636346-Prymnesium_polylepis.1
MPRQRSRPRSGRRSARSASSSPGGRSVPGRGGGVLVRAELLEKAEGGGLHLMHALCTSHVQVPICKSVSGLRRCDSCAM